MNTLSKLLLTALLVIITITQAFAQSPGQEKEEIIDFKFISGEDTFLGPLNGNDAKLDWLFALVDKYHAEITSGKMPVYVNGFCVSMGDDEANRRLVSSRSNLVKSLLITHKGLREEHFITKNQIVAYTGVNGESDMVVVTLRVPEETVDTIKEDTIQSDFESEWVVEIVEAPAIEEVEEEPKRASLIRLDIRTNLLYDAFCLPTLGVEWRVNRKIGIKLDGSRSAWGSKHGKVEKVWMVNPEVRWYMPKNERFYLGVGVNAGEYNIYRGMIGKLFSKNTGYQGKFYGGGITAGYQLPVLYNFSLDFNLGLGYTRYEYDSFTMSNRVRIYKEKDKTRNFFGPTQIGINLIWTIGKAKE